jgi:hypothetical protein
MPQPSSLYKRHRFPGALISHAAWQYSRFLFLLSRTDGAPSLSRVKMAPASVAG